jgi:hypothetical protein
VERERSLGLEASRSFSPLPPPPFELLLRPKARSHEQSRAPAILPRVPLRVFAEAIEYSDRVCRGNFFQLQRIEINPTPDINEKDTHRMRVDAAYCRFDFFTELETFTR